jgi:oligopeptide transport system permease protein
MAALAVIALFVAVAVAAEVVAPYGPAEQFLRAPEAAPTVLDPLAPRETGKFEGPSRAHVFGTDHLARDVFSRTVVGLRISLAAATVAVVVVSAIGISVGTLAVGGPRWLDGVLMRVTDLAFAFPDLLLVILLRAALDGALRGRNVPPEASLLLLFLAISVTAWPTMARLVRGQLLSIRSTEYSAAAVALGVTPLGLAWRHWLPNAVGPVVVEATFLVPRVVFAEAALSFIGIGAAPPTPSLGILIAEHFEFARVQWTALAFPTGALAVLFLSFQVLGDGVRDALDPRARRPSRGS